MLMPREGLRTHFPPAAASTWKVNDRLKSNASILEDLGLLTLAIELQ